MSSSEPRARPLALRSLRSRLGWTQQAMGATLMMGRGHYSSLETGQPKRYRYAPIGLCSTPAAYMRLTLVDALHDIVNANRQSEIIHPNSDLESTWRTILTLAHEIREANRD